MQRRRTRPARVKVGKGGMEKDLRESIMAGTTWERMERGA